MRAHWGKALALILAVFLPTLYLIRLDADTIAGLFGVYTMDEGVYLLSAKNQVLFGQMHFIPNDVWKPELRVSLLHYFAVGVMSAANPVISMRLAVALCVLGAIFTLSFLAAKYHESFEHGLACFLCLLLNPILFFYGRTALSEGVQLLVMAFVLVAFFYLYQARTLKQALLSATAAGGLTGLFFVAKISSIAACGALGLGLLLIVWQNTAITRKPIIILSYILAGLLVLGLYFFLVVGSDRFADWWQVNLQDQGALLQLPLTFQLAYFHIAIRLYYTNYFLTLMPIFALYMPLLQIAANRKKGFLFTLLVITLVMMPLEALMAGDIRRNFYSLTMISLVAGFTCLDYWRVGIDFKKRLTPEFVITAFMLIALAGGVISFLWVKVGKHDTLFIAVSATFLLIFFLTLMVYRPEHASLRKLLTSVVAITSIGIMGHQAFFTPYTARDAIADMETYIEPDTTVIGGTAPTYFLGLKRRIVMTNCHDPHKHFNYANPFNDIAIKGKIDYLSINATDVDICSPPHFSDYALLQPYLIFLPINFADGSDILYRISFMLYEKH